MTSTGKATRDIPDRAINPDGTLLRRFERDGAERIATALDAWRRRIFAGLTDDTITNAVSRVDTESGPLRDVLLFLVQEWAEAGAEFGREQIEALVLGVKRHETMLDFDWQLVNTAALEWAQRYVGELIRGINAVTRRRIQAEVAQFVETGESVLALARRLVGIGPFSDDRARMIAVTEVTRAYAEGNMTAWRETGVIERRRWNTANDELVCPICGPRHNMVVGLDEDFDGLEGPPAHPRCRCWLTPVIVDRQRPVGLRR